MGRLSIVGIGFGVFMMYLSVFGLALPGGFTLTGVLIKADFATSLAPLTPEGPGDLAEVSPPGEAHLRGECLVHSGSPFSGKDQWTVEFRMNIVTFGGSWIYLKTHKTLQSYAWRMTASSIDFNDGSGFDANSVPVAMPVGSWATWRVTLDTTTQVHTWYLDGQQVASFTGVWAVTSGTMFIFGPRRNTPCEVQVDYIYADEGIDTNFGDPPPGDEYATLDINAYYSDEYVTAPITIQWPDGGSTTPTTRYYNEACPVGTYTISCVSYSGDTCDNSPYVVTLGDGDIGEYTFTFAGQPPPPDDDEWWEILVGIVSDPTVKLGLGFGGITIFGLSVISLLVSRKKKRSPIFMPPYM